MLRVIKWCPVVAIALQATRVRTAKRLQFRYFARKHAIFWSPSAAKSSKANKLIHKVERVGNGFAA